jgi:hypothetical protein
MFACEVGHTAQEFFTDMPASMMRRDDERSDSAK